MKEVIFKDTTFRDGLQDGRVEIRDFNQVLKALKKIDQLGVSYLEVGFLTASETSKKRIEIACQLGLKAKVCAFGRTHPRDIEEIINFSKKVNLPAVTLVGKSRESEVKIALRKQPDLYLKEVKNFINVLVKEGLEVIFDAEHYFQAFLEDKKEFALALIKTAFEAGASWIVLCDTNGKMTAGKIAKVVKETISIISGEKLGIHAHNDRGRAVVNSETAWLAGLKLIEGTIGGVGERCGNADLCTLMANLFFDYQAKGIEIKNLKKLTETYLFVSDVLNIPPNLSHPWVGRLAFYTEAGIHQSGLERLKGSYWHALPEIVGNKAWVGVSDQSGKANLKAKAKEFGIEIDASQLEKITKKHQQLVEKGANFGLAEASLYLFFLRELGKIPNEIETKAFRVLVEEIENWPPLAEASLKIKIDSENFTEFGTGAGPVEALDNALRKVLIKKFPEIAKVSLTDFKVTIINAKGTASTVRVLTSFEDKKQQWTTLGVHENILIAAWKALIDGYLYKIVKERPG